MKKGLFIITLICLSLPVYLSAAAQKSKDVFELKMPQSLAQVTGYKTVLLHLNAIDKLTGKTFKQLIDGDEDSTGYQENQCSLSLVFTQNWRNRWNKHIYHSNLLLDHSILHETIYNVPGGHISDPCHIGEILKYVVTIYAYKNGEAYVIAPTDGEYAEYID